MGADSIVQWQEFVHPLPHVNKFRDPYNKNKSSYNIKVLRFADVLLVAAEATNESEGPANAYQYVNRVRERGWIDWILWIVQRTIEGILFIGNSERNLLMKGKIMRNW